MSEDAPREFVAECLWPGVQEEDLVVLDARARHHADRLSAAGTPVHYLGSWLMREDEVVLCWFQGPGAAVREAAEAAQIPFERILETAHSPWVSETRPGVSA